MTKPEVVHITNPCNMRTPTTIEETKHLEASKEKMMDELAQADKAKFCWDCGKRFWGNKKTFIFADGNFHCVHKQCVKNIKGCVSLPGL